MMQVAAAERLAVALSHAMAHAFCVTAATTVFVFTEMSSLATKGRWLEDPASPDFHIVVVWVASQPTMYSGVLGFVGRPLILKWIRNHCGKDKGCPSQEGRKSLGITAVEFLLIRPVLAVLCSKS